MFISARAYTIDMVSFLKVRSPKSAHNLVVHFRSYLAPSLFLADSLEKVPDIQQRVHNTTPPSAMSMCMAGPDHVPEQCLVAILARPVIVSATSIAYVVFIASHCKLPFKRSVHSHRSATTVCISVRVTNSARAKREAHQHQTKC